MAAGIAASRADRDVRQRGRHAAQGLRLRLYAGHGIRHDFAVAFEDATGVLGSSKRLRGAGALWQAARHGCAWLADNRPGIRGLAEMSAADARLLALSCRVLPVAMDEDVGVIGGDDGWAMRTAPLGVVSGAVVGSVTGSSAW